MTSNPGKAPKKVKEKKQTPEERQEALRYNHMMYGRTEGELKRIPKKVDYGVAYLKHPKFISLMTGFKNGSPFKFEVTASAKVYTIATEDAQILFNGKVIFYSRPLNRYEDNLLLDRAAAAQFQTTEAFVHLVFAVLRSFPELGAPTLTYQHATFYQGPEALESGSPDQGSNMLIGPFKHTKHQERPRK